MKFMAPFFLIVLTLSLRLSIADADCRTPNGGSKFASTIVVDKSGGGNFTSVQSAIDSISPNNDQWIKIRINPGVYKECIVLEGQDRSVTTITFDAHDKTDTSSTFTSEVDNIVAKGITFENSYNHPSSLPEGQSSNGPLPDVKQAVAARILGDKSAFFECGFLGLQDTLWDGRGRHYFSKCYIEGAVDFIFDRGQSFYEDCSINVTAGAYSSQRQLGYMTAQGRESSDDPSGSVFKQGIISGSMQFYLGRAYRAYSRVIFQGTTMNAEVVPEGWFAWNFSGKEENFAYAEMNCAGPGSDTSNRVPWEKKLTPTMLEQFSISSFIDQDGWIGREKVTIPKQKPCIVLEGQGRHVTTITFDAHDRTDTSTTFTFYADNIFAKGITFKNSYNRQFDGPIPNVTQAVAARILGDKSAFFECGFLGLQDTLWDALGRHYFYKCYIEGAADFIFGCGQSIYEDCSININSGAYSSRLNQGYITAQGRQSLDDPSGFVFKRGKISGTLQSYLGRAYGPFSTVIFHETIIDAKVIPAGWLTWLYPGKEENFTYAEVNCTGPGSDTSKRVPWEKKLTPSQLEQFSISSYIDQDGWISKLP